MRAFNIWNMIKKKLRKPARSVCFGISLMRFLLLFVLMLYSVVLLAQDGNSGIAEATGKVKGYFNTGTNLMYAIGAVMGLVGAVKVFQKWNGGEQDTSKSASSWFGSCVFLVIVASVLKSFFGV